MATIPTCLYSWCIFLMVEFDAKKFGVKAVASQKFRKTFSSRGTLPPLPHEEDFSGTVTVRPG